MRKLKITELNRISVEEFKEAEKLPLVVVLDNIRSLHNIGSVFRTSDAFRIANLTALCKTAGLSVDTITTEGEVVCLCARNTPQR